MNTPIKGISQTLQGFYKVAVVDAVTNEIKWQQDEWQKNLILNQGMDSIYTRAIGEQMRYGIAGDGTRPNSIDGGASAITQSGATVYLSNVSGDIVDFTSSVSTYPATVQVGDVLKYSDNSESMVSAVNINGRNLTVTPSYTFAGEKTFVIWKTSQVGLESEVKRAGFGIANTSYLNGAGSCETTVVGNTKTHRRTYDFTSESISKTYTEIGVGWAETLASTVFSRVLLPAGITIDAGFKLRIIYDLENTWTPAVTIYKTASVGGWPVAPSTNTIGSESIQTFLTSTISTVDGSTITSTAILEPYFINDSSGNFVNLSLWASPSSTALQAFGSATSRNTNAAFMTSTMTKAAYVASSYYCDKSGTLTVSQINRTDIRSVGLGRYSSGGGYDPTVSIHQVICFLFDQPQTKDSTQTLSFTYRWTWARVLA